LYTSPPLRHQRRGGGGVALLPTKGKKRRDENYLPINCEEATATKSTPIWDECAGKKKKQVRLYGGKNPMKTASAQEAFKEKGGGKIAVHHKRRSSWEGATTSSGVGM